jgi:TP901-1 family phage major tail protein
MTAQRGKDLLLKILNGDSYETVAGLRSRRIAFNAAVIDATDSESAGRWRELLDGGGVKKAAVSGSGIFKDQASDATVRAAFFAGSVLSWRIVIPDFGQVTGPFQIAALDYYGQFDGEVLFDLALESAGPLSFGALA